MGFIVTAYDLDEVSIATALRALADDIVNGDAAVQEAADSISVEANGDDPYVHLGIELDTVLTTEARAQRLLDLDNIEEQ